MPDILEHVAYISQEIGPRPAGTEEEQQAALYITEQMQKEAGLSAVIEDFGGAHGVDAPRVICCACSFVVTALSLFLSFMGIASIVVTLVAAALLAAEVFNRPVLSRAFARGVSQNVVAKYEPGYSAETGGTRRRKVVVVARYDSGKVRSELKSPLLAVIPWVQWAVFGALVFLPLLLIVRTFAFPGAEGAAAVVLNALAVAALVLAAIPLAFALLHKLAAYNEGANCNAAGTAVLLELARRVGRGRLSEEELALREGTAIHGADAALAEGLVPEGAQLVYEAASVMPPDLVPQSAESRLAAAKAAVAALSGKPVSGVSATDIALNLVQVKEPPLAPPTDDDYRALRGQTREALAAIPPDTVNEALAHAESGAPLEDGGWSDHAAQAPCEESAAPTPTPELEPEYVGAVAPSASPAPGDGVPDWFKKAQEKAKKSRVVNKPVQRSRYASALDAAVDQGAERHAAAGRGAEPGAPSTEEGFFAAPHEVKAPQWNAAPDLEQAAAKEDGMRPSAARPAEGQVGEDEPSADPEPAAPAGDEPVSAADPFSTTAMAPIDVSELNLDDVPPMADLPMPAFLDPRKVQKEARASQTDSRRTDNRVDVTGAPIGASGRLEFVQEDAAGAPQPPAALGARTAPVQRPAPPPEPALQPSPDGGVAHQPIVLPDIGASATNLTPISELPKQRAPLADVETAGKSAAKSLLTMLPSIKVEEGAEEREEASPATPDQASSSGGEKGRSALRSMLPSLSGAIGRGGETEAKAANVSAAGSFVPAGATGTFAPIGDELIDDVDPEDIYVDDADDSGYEQDYTETGAFAGAGYVDMPRSRVKRLFDRFRRKKKEEEPSAQEWLEVDETFDARSVGAERGGWESFRDEPPEGEQDEFYEEEAYDFDDAPLEEASFVPEADGRAALAQKAFEGPEGDDEADFEEPGPKKRFPWHGGAFSPRRREDGRLEEEGYDEGLSEASQPAAAAVSSELQQVYQFRNPDINTEMWFVALGSELDQNSGMRAFLTEHQQDLRGAIIIDLEALGSGDLCMVEREGMYRPVKTSSRMKRYVKKASQARGLSVGAAQICWKESAASYAIKHGYQAMHLVGMKDGKPAYFAQGDDVVENIEGETIEANTDFVMELLKNI